MKMKILQSLGMNQAEVHRLVKALKFKVQPKPFVIGKEFGGAYR